MNKKKSEKTTRVSFDVPTEMHTYFKIITAHENTHMSNVLIRFITEYVNSRKNYVKHTYKKK